MDERFTALVRAHRVGLVGYLSRYVDVGTAEELAADAFVSLWQRLPVLRDENLRAYLYASGRTRRATICAKWVASRPLRKCLSRCLRPTRIWMRCLFAMNAAGQSMRRWLILRPITAPCCICSILPVSLPLRPDRCWASRRNRWQPHIPRQGGTPPGAGGTWHHRCG